MPSPKKIENTAKKHSVVVGTSCCEVDYLQPLELKLEIRIRIKVHLYNLLNKNNRIQCSECVICWNKYLLENV